MKSFSSYFIYYSSRKSVLLDELDDLFSEEIASIENLMEERTAEQKKSEEWERRKREEFKKAEKRISAEVSQGNYILLFQKCYRLRKLFQLMLRVWRK